MSFPDARFAAVLPEARGRRRGRACPLPSVCKRCRSLERVGEMLEQRENHAALRQMKCGTGERRTRDRLLESPKVLMRSFDPQFRRFGGPNFRADSCAAFWTVEALGTNFLTPVRSRVSHGAGEYTTPCAFSSLQHRRRWLRRISRNALRQTPCCGLFISTPGRRPRRRISRNGPRHVGLRAPRQTDPEGGFTARRRRSDGEEAISVGRGEIAAIWRRGGRRLLRFTT